MRLCSVHGCERPAERREWCNSHYRRWLKHGTPLGGRTPRGEILRYIESLKGTGETECIRWPYGMHPDGYGQAWYAGRVRQAHRVVLIVSTGANPETPLQAAHLCGKGHCGCVNPNHLEWKTPADNSLDRVRHGTVPLGECHHRSTLSAIQVMAIRVRVAEGATQRHVAEQYGVSQASISDIVRGRTWVHVSNCGAYSTSN